MDVREVRPAEFAAAGDVTVAAYAALPGEHMSDDYARELRDVGRRAQGAVVIVAVDQGRVVGCVTYVPDASSPYAEMLRENEAGIRMMAVDPHAQRRGIATLLLDDCIARARAEGRAALALHSTPWMTGAHALYEKAGFRRAPDRDWTPVPDVPLLGFVLPLAAGEAP